MCDLEEWDRLIILYIIVNLVMRGEGCVISVSPIERRMILMTSVCSLPMIR